MINRVEHGFKIIRENLRVENLADYDFWHEALLYLMTTNVFLESNRK